MQKKFTTHVSNLAKVKGEHTCPTKRYGRSFRKSFSSLRMHFYDITTHYTDTALQSQKDPNQNQAHVKNSNLIHKTKAELYAFPWKQRDPIEAKKQ